MVSDSANNNRKARLLAFAHIITGFLLFWFGVAQHVIHFWSGDACFGIWIGMWMCITGSLGVLATSRDKTTTNEIYVHAFMGFSATSANLGGIIVLFYSKIIDDNARFYITDRDTTMAITAVIRCLGIAEFIIGVWAVKESCKLVKPCPPCPCSVVTLPPEGQPLADPSNSEFTSDGYVMVQGPDGVPKLIPVQSGSSVIAVQASVARGGQPPKSLVPATAEQANDLPQPDLVPIAVPVQRDDCAFVVQSSFSEPKRIPAS